MRPLWEEIEKEIPELITEYFDLDERVDMKEKYEITKAPTFVFLDKDENEFLRLVGPQNKNDLIDSVKENLDK
jgi:thiol-disulfide isomerase/thioredoxin